MRKGFSIIEILVALAVFGLISSALLTGLLGTLQVNKKGALEARALTVAKGYLEKARWETAYSGSTLALPAVGDPQGFTLQVSGGGRSDPAAPLTLSPCSGAPGVGYTCSASCLKNGTPQRCPLVAVEVRLSAGGRSFVFDKEWAP